MSDSDAAGPNPLEDEFPVSYSIYAMARVQRAIAAVGLTELGLFPAQELLLTQLGDNDGQSQKTLATSLGISHVTVAKMTARLERVGLVTRATSDADRRVNRVYLTPAGRAAQQGIRGVWTELEAITNQNLTASERRAYLSSSAKIRRALEESARVEPAAE